VPSLCQLDYPPELFPEDLEGPQLLLLVPSFELGVQACMLLYKLWGGNVSSRTPGDPANMFSYTGPSGIKVTRSMGLRAICLHVTAAQAAFTAAQVAAMWVWHMRSAVLVARVGCRCACTHRPGCLTLMCASTSLSEAPAAPTL